MPDSISSFGEFIAPPHKITSRSAMAVIRSPRWVNTTPWALLPLRITCCVSAKGKRVRFSRARAGFRCAVAARGHPALGEPLPAVATLPDAMGQCRSRFSATALANRRVSRTLFCAGIEDSRESLI